MTDVSAADQDIEAHARAQGWRPLSEYRGDPDKFVDADAFLQRGREMLPVLNAQLRTLTNKNIELNGKVADLGGKLEQTGRQLEETKRLIGDIRDMSVRESRTAYQRGISDAETRMRAAAKDGDPEAYDAAVRERDALAREKPPEAAAEPAKTVAATNGAPVPQQDPGVAAQVQAWLDSPEREWWNKYPDLQSVAGAIHTNLLRTKKHLSVTENLAETEREVKRRFPEFFEDPRRNQSAPAVAVPGGGGSPPSPGTGKRSFDEIADAGERAQAKAAFAKFNDEFKAKKQPEMTATEYLDSYFKKG